MNQRETSKNMREAASDTQSNARSVSSVVTSFSRDSKITIDRMRWKEVKNYCCENEWTTWFRTLILDPTGIHPKWHSFALLKMTGASMPKFPSNASLRILINEGILRNEISSRFLQRQEGPRFRFTQRYKSENLSFTILTIFNHRFNEIVIPYHQNRKWYNYMLLI
jgi:hypothetical protein